MSDRTFGSRPFARLSMSGNAVITSGSSVFIPFDTVDFISDSFGEITFVGGMFGATPVFVCQKGLYFAQMQFAVNVTPTEALISLVSQSGTTADSAIMDIRSSGNVTTTLNANRLFSEIPFAGTPAAFPTVLYAAALIAGASGQILASGTKLFIQQLTANIM